jgi:hypothetical protein
MSAGVRWSQVKEKPDRQSIGKVKGGWDSILTGVIPHLSLPIIPHYSLAIPENSDIKRL